MKFNVMSDCALVILNQKLNNKKNIYIKFNQNFIIYFFNHIFLHLNMCNTNNIVHISILQDVFVKAC